MLAPGLYLSSPSPRRAAASTAVAQAPAQRRRGDSAPQRRCAATNLGTITKRTAHTTYRPAVRLGGYRAPAEFSVAYYTPHRPISTQGGGNDGAPIKLVRVNLTPRAD